MEKNKRGGSRPKAGRARGHTVRGTAHPSEYCADKLRRASQKAKVSLSDYAEQIILKSDEL